MKAIQRLQMCGKCLVKALKTIGKTGKQTEQVIGPTHHAGLATIQLTLTPFFFNDSRDVGSSNLTVF